MSHTVLDVCCILPVSREPSADGGACNQGNVTATSRPQRPDTHCRNTIPFLHCCRAAVLAAAGTTAQLDAAKAELSGLRDTKMLRGDADAVR